MRYNTGDTRLKFQLYFYLTRDAELEMCISDGNEVNVSPLDLFMRGIKKTHEESRIISAIGVISTLPNTPLIISRLHILHQN